MKLDPHSSASAVRSRRLLFAMVCLPVLFALAEPPAWWTERQVLDPNAAKNDYGPANQGQLKNIATKAYAELQAKLPTSAWNTPEGQALGVLITSWTPAQSDNYAPINQGQLKAVAKKFYDVLIQAGYTSAYPWTTTTTDDTNYAPANVGQVKNMFAFDLGSNTSDSDGNGLPDNWEVANFGHIGVDPNADPDGDGLTNSQEYAQSSDPNGYYNGQTPQIMIVAGDNQHGAPGDILPLPLKVQVTNNSGGALANAPVLFSLTAGGGGFFFDDLPQGSSATVRTDAAGDAAVFFQMPQVTAALSRINAQAGLGSQAASAFFAERTYALEVTPEDLSFLFLVNLPEIQSTTVVLENHGQAPLDFDTEAQAPYYRFEDSDSPTGPAYQWADISATGTVLPVISDADDDFESFDLPFSFPYFGQSYTKVFVSSNGFITFGQGSAQYDNQELPSTNMPANEIAAFHADLNPSAGGAIYYRNETDRTVIQFNQVEHYDESGPVTFQIILERSGTVTIFYKSMAGTLVAATVGMQNLLKDQGVEVAYDRDYVKDSLALRFTNDNNWLQISPGSGEIGAGQSVSLTVTVDSTALFEGNYTGSLRVWSTQDGSNFELPATAVVDTPPTVQLVAPQAGGGFIVGESVTLQAQASDRNGPVARVEFYEGANLIGVANAEPFQATWQITHASPVTLMARAVDGSGVASNSPVVELRVEQDIDGDGLGDAWEMANFGNLSQTGNGDFDGDGISNLQEFKNGTAGDDYYNGQTPFPVLRARSGGADKSKCGFVGYEPSTPPKKYRQQDRHIEWSLVSHDCYTGSNEYAGSGSGSSDARWDGCTSLITPTYERSSYNQTQCDGSVIYRPCTDCPGIALQCADYGIAGFCVPTADSPTQKHCNCSFDQGSGPGFYGYHIEITDVYTLSNEYTTDLLVARTQAAMKPIPDLDAPPDPSEDVEFATFQMDPDQSSVHITQSNYQFKWYQSPNLPQDKKITWLEIFYPADDPRTTEIEDTTPVTTVRSWEGTADRTDTYYLSPTVQGRYQIVPSSVELTQLNYPTSADTTDLGPTAEKSISEDAVAYITGVPEMPRLEASLGGGSLSEMTVEWRMEVKTERTERGTKDDFTIPATGTIPVPMDQPWKIYESYTAPRDFLGGNVTVFFRIKKADGSYLMPAEQAMTFKIRGKNPKDADAKSYIQSTEGDYRFAWAMVQHESRQTVNNVDRIYNQFNAGGSSKELPNFSGNYPTEDGWGIAQLDTPLGVSATTSEVYGWQQNVTKFYEELNLKKSDADRFIRWIRNRWGNDPRWEEPPATWTVSNSAFTPVDLATIVLYNGAAGIPLSYGTDDNGVSQSFHSPWTFDPDQQSGQRWVFHDNTNPVNNLHYATTVIHDEWEGALPSAE